MALQGYAAREPDVISAGDTLAWERCLPACPASQGWTLSYSVIGLSTVINFQSVANGDGHAIFVPGATTALWLPSNDSVLVGYALFPGNPNANPAIPPLRQTIYYQLMPVKPNLQNAPADQPSKTFAELMIEKLKALLISTADDNLLIAHVGDSSFRFENREKVYDMLCQMETRHRVEVDKQRAENGKPSRRRIVPVMNVTPPGPLWGAQFPSQFIGNL